MGNQEKRIIVIQNWYRNIVKLRIDILHRLNQDINDLYYLIFSTMNNIQTNFFSSIFTQNKYNTSMVQLDSLLDKFKMVPYPLNLKNLYNIGEEKLIHLLSDIKLELITIVKNNGMEKTMDIIKLVANIKSEVIDKVFDINELKFLKFYDKSFTPINCDIYTLNGEPKYNSDIQCKNTEEKLDLNSPTATTQLIAFVKKSIDSNIQQNAINYDKNIIENIEVITIKNLYFKANSLCENIQGARLYIPIQKENLILVMNGYFKDDPINIARIGGIFEKKNKELIDRLNKISNIPTNYKHAFIEQITLRDFVVSDIDNLITNCSEAYSELKKLKSKTISALVKEFLTSDVERQRHILTLFLLTDNDTDTQYLAYLMYDMISNESYLLKPQPLAEQVYNSLHWSVQKLFKIAIKRVNKKTQSLMDFNENDIPYEKRICLLKADDSIKGKAMDKYKEVQAKSGDSAAKAQQYLDAILKIPFGIFKKEPIMIMMGDFISKYSTFFTESISILENGKKKNKKLLIIFKNYNKTDIKSTTIDGFNNLILKMYSESSFSNNCNSIENIDNLKISEIKETFKNINYKNKLPKKKAELVTLLKEISKDNSTPLVSCETEQIKNNHMLLNKEWNNYKQEKKNYLENVRKILDLSVHGHNEAKSQIERVIAQWINGEMKGYCFGFEGPPGTGKTSLAKKGLTQCLKDENGNSRPFSFIALGGSSNGATLEGHSYTYVGSTWGRIVDILMESKTMNPIIFIDELDKVSKTEHGKEIIGILTHLTDSTQNDEFSDKYFSGIKFDLSKILIVFSYNDPESIDRILLDRIHRVQFKNLNLSDKLNVANSHLLPEIYRTVGIDPNCIQINNETLEFIIETYTFEAGARKLKEKLFEIIREINLRYLTSESVTFPLQIDNKIVEEIFHKKSKIHYKTIAKQDRIGLVNGLYATAMGIGGLTIIETYQTPSDNFLALILTGQQGDVMQESVKCAKTIAWNLIPDIYKQKLKKQSEVSGNFGLHIHCPEAATPKDGPSAGAAMTLCLLSVLMGLKINKFVAMTGEIDLNGSVHAIGGLDSKVEGAKRAGAKIVLCPKQNENDVNNIRNSEIPPENENFKIIMVEDIWEVINYALINEDNIEFKKYISDN